MGGVFWVLGSGDGGAGVGRLGCPVLSGLGGGATGDRGGWMGWVASGLAQEDADGVGRGGKEVPRRGLDGMTRDQSMAVGSRG